MENGNSTECSVNKSQKLSKESQEALNAFYNSKMSKEDLDSSLSSKKNKRPYNCHISGCEKTYYSIYRLKIHLRVHVRKIKIKK